MIAVRELQDEVYQRVADIEDWSSLIASDVYFHKDCKKNYMMKFQSMLADCLLCESKVCHTSRYKLDIGSISVLLTVAREKQCTDIYEKISRYFDEAGNLITPCFAHDNCRLLFMQDSEIVSTELYKIHAVPLVEDMLEKQYFLSMADIRHRLEDVNPQKRFYNHLIKQFLENHFGERILFCKPFRANEAVIVYPSSISKDEMVRRMQNFSVLRTAGKLIRAKLLREVDFGLEDRFNDKIKKI